MLLGCYHAHQAAGDTQQPMTPGGLLLLLLLLLLQGRG
jgi:hypothetical protein